MDLTLKALIGAAVDTIRDPRAGARKIMNLSASRKQRWEILALIVVLSAVLAQLSYLLAGQSDATIAGPFPSNPITLGIVQAVLLVAMVFATHFIGRRVGGTGGFDDAILLVAWLQFIMICLQVLQTIALFFIPAVSMLIGVAGLLLFFWLLANFIAELHGFKSLTAIFIGIILSMLAFAIAMSILLGLFGLYLPGVPANV